MNEHDFEMAGIQLFEGEGWNYLPLELQPERDCRNPLLVNKYRYAIGNLPCNKSVPRVTVDDCAELHGWMQTRCEDSRPLQYRTDAKGNLLFWQCA